MTRLVHCIGEINLIYSQLSKNTTGRRDVWRIFKERTGTTLPMPCCEEEEQQQALAAETIGINVNGRPINILRFADDTVLKA